MISHPNTRVGLISLGCPKNLVDSEVMLGSLVEKGFEFSSSVDDCDIAVINTLEGYLIISDGDWIITGVQGERYPCKPDIFKETYEVVE